VTSGSEGAVIRGEVSAEVDAVRERSPEMRSPKALVETDRRGLSFAP
jgi:hypothetical protein